MGHPIYPIASLLVVPLVLCSLPAHIRSRNIAVISLILWAAVLAFIRGVNAIVWYGNVEVRLLFFFFSATKITIGWAIAIPLTMLCLVKHLESIAANRQAVTTERDKRRRMIFETVMCYFVPMVYMALHYVVQGHRFDIYEDFGCYPTTYASVASLVMLYLPPFLISVVSMVYAILAIYHFFRRRVIFTSILQSSNSYISQSHYFRLMALGIVECLWDTGLNSWNLASNIQAGFRPWISWENVHSHFSFVQPLPWILLDESFVRLIVIQWWIVPISTIAVFFFFAFGAEAKADYLMVWRFIKHKIFRIPDTRRQSLGDLPMYIDSPLPVTRLSKYMDEKSGKDSKNSSTEAPWEKIKLDISQTQSFSSSNDGYSPSPLTSSTSSASLVEKEKRIVLSPVTEPAPTYHPQHPVPIALPSTLTFVPSRNPTPELRITGPFESDSRRPSVGMDDSSAHLSTSRRGSESSNV